MALNAQILLSILAHESDAGDISQTLRATPATYALALTDGTGANQAQVVWSDARPLSSGQQDTIDLAGLTDDRGTVAFTAIKAMYLRNTGAVTVYWDGGSWNTGPLSHPNDSTMAIPPGGAALFVAPTAAGYAASASPQTIDLGTAGAGASSYEIILIGEGTIT